ncbi:MAG: Gfo/Idh/MocA family oxidoreductase [Silicimonas sp.]|nr:Gfo/Idh/MocA family oxidoreductase [Silicimonas sp.]
MSATFTIACLGAGYFARFHHDAWRRIEGARLLAVADHDLAAAQASGVSAYDSLAPMLEAVAPDVVDIITPPATHLEAIRTALAAWPRAIICQKPFCTSPTEALKAVDLAEAAGIPLIIHENFRFQPWYRRIRAELDAGKLGTPLNLTFRLRPGDGQGPSAYLDRQPYFQEMERFLIRETAVHWIDTFRFLMGPPARVFADLRRLNPAIAGEDASTLIFDYGDGRRALFDGNRLLDHSAENTRCTMGEALIEGTEGTLTLKGDGSLHLRRFGETDTTCLLPPTAATGFGGDCVFHLQSHVIRALDGKADFENTARDYLEVIRQEEALYRSADTGTWVTL